MQTVPSRTTNDPEKPQPEKPKTQNKATEKATKPVTPNGKKAVAGQATNLTQPEAEQESEKKELAANRGGKLASPL